MWVCRTEGEGGAVTKQHDYLSDLKSNIFLYSLNVYIVLMSTVFKISLFNAL